MGFAFKASAWEKRMAGVMRRSLGWGIKKLISAKVRVRFIKDFLEFQRLASASEDRFVISWDNRYPCLDDKTADTGFDRHYIYHTAWAARVIRETEPKIHVDVSSSLYFSGIVSAFYPVKFYDYRPADLKLTGFESGTADLRKLPFSNGSIASLSCMHVVEHIGLGRYGDALDPDGDLKAISELRRVLAPGGNLFFVVPVGQPRLMFNAHRVYGYDQIRKYFSDLDIQQFALIPDTAEQGGLVYEGAEELVGKQKYGCGCFWFKKTQ